MQQKFEGMKLKPIKTEEDYNLALARIDEIFDAEPGTNKGDELELLSILIDNYEEENHSIELPDPIEAIKFRLEQLGLNQKDFSKIVGHKGRASEILNKKRKLSLRMIRNLKSRLAIPSDVLIQEY